jgi:hypothetical protein
MKFSEIKDKIKNLGDFKTLSDIKKAGLRICRNTKTGDYWLIEEEFLKPVITEFENCKKIGIEPNLSVFMYPEINLGQKTYKANDYIEWGKNVKSQGRQKQKAGIPLPKLRSLEGRKYWYSFNPSKKLLSNLFWQKRIGERFSVFLSSNPVFADQKFYPLLNLKAPLKETLILLNSIIQRLILEIEAISYTGAYTLVEMPVKDVEKILIVNPQIIKNDATTVVKDKSFKSIFEELGIKKDKPIRSQQPNPLPDRKALDDIVFDALGLTDQERKEVYWAVAELVKNRLEKAKNV